MIDRLLFEKEAYATGYRAVAGIDEAGRGPLAGPVVAAAVVLPPGGDFEAVGDSKELTPSRREVLDAMIRSRALAVGVGLVEAPEIDRINILKATFLAMRIAVGGLQAIPDFLLIDGPYSLPLPVAQRGIPKGDRLSLSIGAASIVAKVHRDRLMREYHLLYPVYGFDRHKGYGSKSHLEALRRHGPCPIHRMTFRGVRQ
jgi:ribonuclease HII